MAGTINGWAPSDWKCSTAALMISAIFATPRLPAVIATESPGLTCRPRSRRASSAATVCGMSFTGSVGDSKDCRTRNRAGYCDIDDRGSGLFEFLTITPKQVVLSHRLMHANCHFLAAQFSLIQM